MQNNLTTREEEVYRYLLKGLNYLDIQDQLAISNGTARTHISNIYMKMMVNNRAELMAKRIEELENEIENIKRTNSITRV